MDALTAQRLRMVERDLVSRGICDPAVLDAMRSVPRHLFVEAAEAYGDEPLEIPEGQSISQPYIVALMLEQAKLERGDRMLEVGTGSGYAAAVASRVCREVFTIERHARLARIATAHLADYPNVHVLCADGMLGWPAHAPFEAITVAAAGRAVPPDLLHQLAPGGRLLMPLELNSDQRLIRITRTGASDFTREDLLHVRFVPLVPGSSHPS